MNNDDLPFPSLLQLEESARRLMEQRVLSKGGKRPSEKALAMWCRHMALKALKDLETGKSAWPPSISAR